VIVRTPPEIAARSPARLIGAGLRPVEGVPEDSDELLVASFSS